MNLRRSRSFRLLAFEEVSVDGRIKIEEDTAAGLFRTTFSTQPIYGNNDSILRDGDVVVRHPRGVGRARSAGVIELQSRAEAKRADLILTPQRFIAAAWNDINLPFPVGQQTERGWDFGPLEVRFNSVGKWSFTLSPSAPGTYRLIIRVQPNFVETPTLYLAKLPGHSSAVPNLATGDARWPSARFDFGFADMVSDIDTVIADGNDIVITTQPAILAALGSKTWDPSFTDDADWGADVTGSTKFPNDGSDWCLDDGSEYRVANKFTISSLPTDDTVDQVDTDIDVGVSAGASGQHALGPYNGDGQADPEADAGGTMFTRCDVSGDNYTSGVIFNGTGVKTFTDLGAQAESDVEAARDAGNIFSLAYITTNANSSCELEEYTDATNPPSLTVTHSTAGATATSVQVISTFTQQADILETITGTSVQEVSAVEQNANVVMVPDITSVQEVQVVEQVSSVDQVFDIAAISEIAVIEQAAALQQDFIISSVQEMNVLELAAVVSETFTGTSAQGLSVFEMLANLLETIENSSSQSIDQILVAATLVSGGDRSIVSTQVMQQAQLLSQTTTSPDTTAQMVLRLIEQLATIDIVGGSPTREWTLEELQGQVYQAEARHRNAEHALNLHLHHIHRLRGEAAIARRLASLANTPSKETDFLNSAAVYEQQVADLEALSPSLETEVAARLAEYNAIITQREIFVTA